MEAKTWRQQTHVSHTILKSNCQVYFGIGLYDKQEGGRRGWEGGKRGGKERR